MLGYEWYMGKCLNTPQCGLMSWNFPIYKKFTSGVCIWVVSHPISKLVIWSHSTPQAGPELTSLRRGLAVPGEFFGGALEKIGKYFEKIGNNLKKLESMLVCGWSINDIFPNFKDKKIHQLFHSIFDSYLFQFFQVKRENTEALIQRVKNST